MRKGWDEHDCSEYDSLLKSSFLLYSLRDNGEMWPSGYLIYPERTILVRPSTKLPSIHSMSFMKGIE